MKPNSQDRVWILRHSDGSRYTHTSVFSPTSSLGEMHPKRCCMCHRIMGVTLGEWYHCISHGYQGKIITADEHTERLRNVDPRFLTIAPP